MSVNDMRLTFFGIALIVNGFILYQLHADIVRLRAELAALRKGKP